jgi:hypothetical protein
VLGETTLGIVKLAPASLKKSPKSRELQNVRCSKCKQRLAPQVGLETTSNVNASAYRAQTAAKVYEKQGQFKLSDCKVIVDGIHAVPRSTVSVIACRELYLTQPIENK